MDPATGTLALDMQQQYGDMVQGQWGMDVNTIATRSPLGTDAQNETGHSYFPFHYAEITWRFDVTPDYVGGAMWSQAYQYPLNGGAYLERDDWECGNIIGTKCNTEGTIWNPNYGGYIESAITPFTTGPPFDPTQYHTWGVLWSGDGNGNYSVCTYVDGTRVNCLFDGNPAGNSIPPAIRQWKRVEIGIYNPCDGTLGDFQCLPDYGTRNLYVKNVKILSCANVASTSETCHGTTNNGNFYQ